MELNSAVARSVAAMAMPTPMEATPDPSSTAVDLNMIFTVLVFIASPFLRALMIETRGRRCRSCGCWSYVVLFVVG